MLEMITKQAAAAAGELIAAAKVEKGGIIVVGCSSSEVGGEKIGTSSSIDIAKAVFEGIYPVVKENGLYLAAQCCEHLGRAIIIEREAADKYGLTRVNVIPQPKAGGSFATTAYANFENPCAVYEVAADCGMDIGGTLIGMHLKRVAVPVRVSENKIGEAILLCARTRLPFVGGSRAVYDEKYL